MIEQANFSLQKVINKLLEITTKEKDIDTFLIKSLDVIVGETELLGFLDKGIIFLKRNNEFMKVIAHKNIDEAVLKQCGHVRKKDCVCGKALCSITHQFKEDVSKVHNNKVILTEKNICSFPINYKDNCYGVLTLYLKDEAYYFETTVNEITSICNTIGLVIHEKRMQRYADFVKNKLDVSYGDQYFKHLANFFIEEFKMKYCFIGTYNNSLEQISSIVFMDKNEQLDDIVCNIENSPTEVLLKEHFCMFPKNVQTIFPDDVELKKYDVQSYVGILLHNENETPVGAILLMHDKAIDEKEQEDMKQVLSIFTPRLRGECERKLHENNLFIEQEKYKNIIEELQDVFIRTKITDDGNEIIEASPSAFKFSGYQPEDLIGKSPEIFYFDLNQRKAFHQKLFEDKKVENFPLTFVKKNQDLIHAKINAQLICDENSIPIEIRIFGRDITESINEEIRKEIAYVVAKKSQRRAININTISEYLYKMLGRVTNVSNFYISFFNEAEKTIFFPVHADGEDNKIEFEVEKEFNSNGFFEYIISHKSSIIHNEAELHELILRNRLKVTRTVPKSLVSFPIRNEGKVVGALTVMSYTTSKTICNSDLELLEFVSTQLSTIVEREQWQKSLIEKEKYFRTLVESSHEVIGIVDVNGVMQYISESVKSILGYNSYEMIGKSFVDFVPEYYIQQVKHNFDKTTQQLRNNNSDTVKVINKNGETRIIHFTLNNQLTNNVVQGIVFNAQDITEKHYAQKKLEASKAKLIEQEKNYRNIFNNSNDGIVLFDENFKIIDVNKRMTAISGFTKYELLKSSILETLQYTENNEIIKEIRKLDGINKKSVLVEKIIPHKENKILYCKVFVKKIPESENEQGYFIAFITDITKSNEAIQKAIDLENALHYTTNVIYADLTGKIMNVSENVSKKSGYSKKELIGASTKIFNSNFHPKEFFKEMWETILKGDVWSGEVRNKRKDGSIYWVYSTIIPIRDIYKKVAYFINVQQDITEVKQVKLNRIRDVIDAQEKEKENFAKELHDGLGQILLASKMNLSSLQEDMLKLDEPILDVYNNSMKLLTASIQEARNVSHGLMTRVLAQFGLAQAIDDAINNVNMLDKSLVFTFKHNIEGVRFEGEQEKALYRVVQELITNILKHSKASKASINLNLDNNLLHIEVKDNGVGLFNNLKDNGSKGIGLKNIETRLDYLSGTFKISDKVKNGTKINIVVPVSFFDK